MREAHGWLDVPVRNPDGRVGAISSEELLLGGRRLGITCADGTEGWVMLANNGNDRGEAGWQWWCPEFSEGAAWLPLGDKGAARVLGQPPLATTEEQR